ncbi:MAG: hypothetical protein AAGK97_18045, partial [Bacteroidota bacterium]
VTLGTNVSSIGISAFQFNDAVNPGSGEHKVIFLGNTPPTIQAASFADQSFNPNRQDISVTVPCSALTTYTSNTSYSGFFEISCATIWNGNSWSDGVPNSGIDALIAGDYNTITNGNVNAATLTVQNEYSLTVTDNTSIQTQSDIIVNGTLDIANAGSVVQIADNAVTINNGTITVAKTTPSLNPRDFIVLSSPMTEETNGNVYGTADRVFRILSDNFIPNSDVTAAFPMAANFIDDNGDYLDNLELDNPNMMDDATGLNNILNPAEGFLVFPQAVNATDPMVLNHTYTQGTLNSGDVTATITYNGATTSNFNLLGNPYASAIDTDMLIATNDAINEVYFWEHITAPDANLP